MKWYFWIILIIIAYIVTSTGLRWYVSPWDRPAFLKPTQKCALEEYCFKDKCPPGYLDLNKYQEYRMVCPEKTQICCSPTLHYPAV